MKHEHNFLERLADHADLLGEPVSGCSLVEIAGDHRVLIENHFGICQYSREEICVKVQFGVVSVCGYALELDRMTKEQMIISGKIQRIGLIRRER